VKHGPLLPFVEVEEGALEQRKILAFRQDVVRSQRTGRALHVDRVLAPDWVNVVAFVDDELLCVRQWRFGSRTFTLELPSGLIEQDEPPLQAGLRELREETGCAPRSGTVGKLIGSVQTNPAFMNNRCYTVLVEDAVQVGALELDENEELEVVRVPRASLEERCRDGTFDTALGLVALQWFALYGASR
jgi:8-oxo-dGTP pyrophosphatase MutT (NUDIX family)